MHYSLVFICSLLCYKLCSVLGHYTNIWLYFPSHCVKLIVCMVTSVFLLWKILYCNLLEINSEYPCGNAGNAGRGCCRTRVRALVTRHRQSQRTPSHPPGPRCPALRTGAQRTGAARRSRSEETRETSGRGRVLDTGCPGPPSPQAVPGVPRGGSRPAAVFLLRPVRVPNGGMWKGNTACDTPTKPSSTVQNY